MIQPKPAVDPHAVPLTSLVALTKSIWRNRRLIVQMAKREVSGRYRGSFLGVAWSFFVPVLMLIIYTFVFSVAFKARWGLDSDETRTDFAIALFVGLIVHGIFAECINRSPGLILTNVNFVKKVVFPLEILPWVAVSSALFHAMMSMVMLIAAMLILGNPLHITMCFVPFVVFPLLTATVGFSFFLAATGVYIRDISQLTGVLTSILLFLAPVFYPVSALPEEYRNLLYLNPLTFTIEEMRKVLLWGKLPDLAGLLVYFGLSLLVLWLGFWWFQKSRKGFADVI